MIFRNSLFTSLLLSIFAFSTANAQTRGKELYDLILEGGLTQTEGITRVTWLPDGRGYLEREGGPGGDGTAFFRVDPASGNREPLFDPDVERGILAEYHRLTAAEARGLPFAAFSYERDGSALLFEVEKDAFLYDLERQSMRKLHRPGDIPPFLYEQPSGAFSPDFNSYVFVRDYDNLFVMDTRTGEERQLVEGSSEDKLVALLGVGNWFVWSPDSRMVAYVRADDSVLSKIPQINSLETKPEIEWGRYPFASDPDPTLELHVIDVASGRGRRIAVTTEEVPYLRNIVWLPDASEVTFQLVNRWQNRLDLMAGDPQTGETRTILTEREEAYLDPPENFQLLDDGRRFTWSSERSGWRHIYLYDIEGNLLRQLTDGEWESGTIFLIDEDNGWIYFDGYEDYGSNQLFYRVPLAGGEVRRLTPEDGMHSVSIDPAGGFFVDDYSSMTTPRTVNLHRSDGQLIRNLASTNTDKVDELGLFPPDVFLLKAADGVTDMQAMLFKPADFDRTKQYPLILYVYGGPHSKFIFNRYVSDVFPLPFFAGSGLLPPAAVPQLGFLFLWVDARGTPYRGKQFQSANYLQLGQLDVDDYAAAARQVREWPFVDGSRVGITGISHGGYMTTMLMLRYPEVFQVGAAGAPAGDVANGPKQYFGRFMRTPQGNPEGYEKANPLNYVDRLQGKFLIYHGTADRNAVFSGTMQLVHALIEADKPFDLAVYPEGAHVFQGKNAAHALKVIVGYFVEHLKPENWERTLEALWSK